MWKQGKNPSPDYQEIPRVVDYKRAGILGVMVLHRP
jgi:hypothetical protein